MNSQSNEAVADHQGLEMMAAAGYQPDAGVRLLETLFRGHESPQMNVLLDSARAAAQAHHHEGVRLILAQAQAENIKRLDPAARERSEQELDPSLKLTVAPRIAPPPATKEQAECDDKAVRLARAFLKEEPLKSGWGGPVPRDYNLVSDTVSRFEGATPRQGALAMLAVIDDLRQAPGPAQAKGDAFLLAYLSLQDRVPGKTLQFDGLEERHKVRDFLLGCSVGGWKAEPLLDKMVVGENNFSHRHNLVQLVKAPDFQEIASPLYLLSSAWKGLVDRLPTLEDKRSSQFYYAADLAEEVAKRADKGEQAPLDTPLKASVLRFLKEAGMRPELVDSLKSYRELQLERFLKAEPDVRAAAEPIARTYEAFRVDAVQQAMQQDGPTACEGLDAYNDSLEELPTGDREREQLRPAWLTFANRAMRELDPAVGKLSLSARHELMGELVPCLGQAPDHKMRDFLFTLCPVGTSLPRQGARGETYRALSQSLEGLSKEQLFRLTEDDSSLKACMQPLSEAASRMLGKSVTESECLSLTYEKDLRGFFDQDVHKRDREAESTGRAIMQRWANQVIAPLTLLGSNARLRSEMLDKLDHSDVQRLLAGVDKVLGDQEKSPYDSLWTIFGLGQPGLNRDARLFLLDGVARTREQLGGLDGWTKAMGTVLGGARTSPGDLLDGHQKLRSDLSGYLERELGSLPPDQLGERLKNPAIRDFLLPEAEAGMLSRLALKGGLDRQQLAAANRQLEKDFSISKRPTVERRFREMVAEGARLQPNELDAIFPPDKRTFSDRAALLQKEVRGLSALVSAAWTRPVEDQLATVDYLMGRRSELPDYLSGMEADLEGKSTRVTLTPLMEEARAAMQRADLGLRTLVAGSFLGGPNSFFARPEGRAELVEHLMGDVRPERRDLARELAHALIEAHGTNAAVAAGFALAQPPGEKGSEGELLSNLMDAYGVPGVKFKQYLAFTSQMQEYSQVFEEAQDHALPLSYLEGVRLAEHHLGKEWPAHWKLEGIKGSGSVNVALRILDERDGKHKILTLPRENVDQTAGYDFMRLRNFLETLTKTPENRERYGFLLGLLQVIEPSVGLEFDRQNAAEMQKAVQPLYNREVNGWKVRTVSVLEQHGDAILMDEAPGSTARKVLESDPATYRSAMGALAEVERDVLLGVDQSGKARPVPLHANPDFHDGQVLIDPVTRTVTLLDFGQAVPISNERRDYGVDLLSILSGARKPEVAARMLSERSGVAIRAEEVAPLIGGREPMDGFVRLLGMMNVKGAQVPQDVVHWILAVNRQRKLGAKMGRPVDGELRTTIVGRKLGASLETTNLVVHAQRSLTQLTRSLTGWWPDF